MEFLKDIVIASPTHSYLAPRSFHFRFLYPEHDCGDHYIGDLEELTNMQSEVQLSQNEVFDKFVFNYDKDNS